MYNQQIICDNCTKQLYSNCISICIHALDITVNNITLDSQYNYKNVHFCNIECLTDFFTKLVKKMGVVENKGSK